MTFHENLTVFVGDNGRGKTAIMDATAVILAQVVDEFTGCRQSDGITQGDVRLVCDAAKNQTPRIPTRIEAVATINGNDVNWGSKRKYYDRSLRSSPNALARLMAVVEVLRSASSQGSNADHSSLLPVIAYYASTRFANDNYFGIRLRDKYFHIEDKFVGYRGFLDPLSDLQHFNEWYDRMNAAVRTHVPIGASRDDAPMRQLTAVRVAVDCVLKPTGWRNIDWDKTKECVVAEHPDQGRMPLAALSSGVRNMVALTADLAHRCAQLNPVLGEDAAFRTPGIVLIDEVDLHLHPAWQQLVVGLLREAFPKIQFIMSTHSPQVLSTIKSESIRVINLCDGDGNIETPLFQTRGVESADVLATVMGVDPVPRVEEAEILNRYRALIEEGTCDAEEGRDLRARLISHFGLQHPLMLDCDRLIRFSAFKRRAVGKE